MLWTAGRRSRKGGALIASRLLQAPRLAKPRPRCYLARRPQRGSRTGSRARSSAGEHYRDMVGVTGSIPVAPTTTLEQEPLIFPVVLQRVVQPKSSQIRSTEQAVTTVSQRGLC